MCRRRSWRVSNPWAHSACATLAATMLDAKLLRHFRVEPDKKFRLKHHDPAWAGAEHLTDQGMVAAKEQARAVLEKNRVELAEAQDLLYADDRYAILVVLQAMDAAGKDGTIKHVMSGLNPEACSVFSF